MQLEAHPIAEIFPVTGEKDYTGLLNDMREHGQLDPIELYEKKILDGRSRYRACIELGIKPVTEQWVPNRRSPLEYVVSKNLHRRHLTVAQKATLAVELLPRLKDEAGLRKNEGQKRGGEVHNLLPSEREGKQRETTAQKAARAVDEMPKGEAAKIAADMLGIGRTSVLAAELISKNEPVYEKMRRGEISVNAAAREAGIGTGTFTPKKKRTKKPKPTPAYSEQEIAALLLEWPCPKCGRWTPSWVISGSAPPEGHTWRYDANRNKRPRPGKK